MEKKNFVSDWHHLKTRCAALEREQAAQLRRRQASLGREASALQEYAVKLMNDRKLESRHQQQHIARIKGVVDRFRQSLSAVKSNPKSADRVKQLMEDVDTNVKSFKERQRKPFDELLHEEQILTEAIASMEKKVEMWERQTVAAPTAAAKTSAASRGQRSAIAGASSTKVDMPPAVADFERLLHQAGGHQGGWDDIDHQAFVQLRLKFKGKDDFNELLSARIAGRTPGDVSHHESWYVEYRLLLERKKEAIQKWKDDRKGIINSQVPAEEEETTVDDAEAAKEELRRLKVKAERHEKKERVQKWRMEQKDLLEKEQQAVLEIQRQKTAAEAARLTAERVQQTQRMDEFRQRRQVEKAMRNDAEMLLRQEEAEQRRLATQQLGKFQDRDRHAMEERRQKQLEKERMEQEKAERLAQLKSQVAVNVQRDPSRLTKMTAGWEERRKQTVENRCRDTTGPSMSTMPHRAVPSWRQGL